MASSYLNRSVFLGGDQMKASLFFVVLLVAETLKDDIRLVRLVNGHHLDIFCIESNDLREGELANFAFKLGEVIRSGDAFQFLLDFAIDPSPQASNMDHPAASLAITGGNKRISFGLLVAQAHFAVVLSFSHRFVMGFFVLADLKDSVSLFEMVGVPEGKGFTLIFRLNDHVLHSSQLNHISRP